MNASYPQRDELAALLRAEGATLVNPPILLPATPYYDLAGEDFGSRLLLTIGSDGEEYCLRPEFTLPIAVDYLDNHDEGSAAAYGYMGDIFRQRVQGPAEFEQAGLELIGQPDPDQALDRVFTFILEAMRIYGLKTDLRLGSVELFEALLAQADMPDVWRGRIRHRFGNAEAMGRLLDRLANPHGDAKSGIPWKREELVNVIADQMDKAGLSLTGSRSPEEIVTRYFEKQALAEARVPAETIALLRNYLAIDTDARLALIAIEGLAEDLGLDLSAPLTRLNQHIGALEASEQTSGLRFDAGFSPRLDYYTGLVFEISGQNGPLASGGEYNRLMTRLGAQAEIPASGAALWLHRMAEEGSK